MDVSGHPANEKRVNKMRKNDISTTRGNEEETKIKFINAKKNVDK